jgi:death-on-curing protein
MRKKGKLEAGKPIRMLKYLSREEIIETNKKIVGKSGEIFAIANEGNLDYLIYAAGQKFFGKNMEEAIYYKAAFLLRFMAHEGHIFIEGNKRTSYSAAEAFLRENGYEIGYNDHSEALLLVLGAAKGEIGIGTIAEWLRKNVIKAGNQKNID